MFEPRPTKCRGTGIGSKRQGERKSFWRSNVKLNRTPLKKVSKKQRKRNAVLKVKLRVLLTKQVELYGTPRCEIGYKLGDGKCFGVLTVDHVIHRSRRPPNVDGYWNLQVACEYHNCNKGSRVLDCRPPVMREACQQLDQEG